MNRKTDFRNGFTLLEILIAVSILATAFTILLASQGSNFLSSERADYLTTATFLARQKMVELEMDFEKDMARGKFPDEKEEEGTFEDKFEDFRWKVKIKKVEIPTVIPETEETKNNLVATYLKQITDQLSKAVREISLTVYWGDKDKPLKDQPHMTVTTHIVNLK
ncbi:MAG: hypothetical protein A2048_09225 [Deltaproteobacteria bacterium GWA2_45_12]|nr:MAG: hypothetical protein A2048_09225 [Deltaproteobacteria bacterium GWA2_45_12]